MIFQELLCCEIGPYFVCVLGCTIVWGTNDGDVNNMRVRREPNQTRAYWVANQIVNGLQVVTR